MANQLGDASLYTPMDAATADLYHKVRRESIDKQANELIRLANELDNLLKQPGLVLQREGMDKFFRGNWSIKTIRGVSLSKLTDALGTLQATLLAANRNGTLEPK